MAIGTETIVRLMHKFVEILVVVQPGLSLSRAKAACSCRLSVCTFCQLIKSLFNLQNGTTCSSQNPVFVAKFSAGQGCYVG